MAIALVQHTSNTTLSSTTVAQAFASNVTVGNLLVAQVIFPTGLTCTVTDSRGFTWTSRPKIDPILTTGAAQEFIAPNVGSSGASTVTATFSGSSSASSLLISEWSGAQAGAVFDSGNLASDAVGTGTSAAPLSQSVTPSMPGCLVLGLEENAGLGAATAGAGYTLLDNSPTIAIANVYQIQTTATATQTAFAITSAAWTAFALILQPASPIDDTAYLPRTIPEDTDVVTVFS
jgi:hypothetical protein